MEQQWFHNHHTTSFYVATHFFFDVPVYGFGAVNAFAMRIGNYF
jgi:hypothetical protein